MNLNSTKSIVNSIFPSNNLRPSSSPSASPRNNISNSSSSITSSRRKQIPQSRSNIFAPTASIFTPYKTSSSSSSKVPKVDHRRRLHATLKVLQHVNKEEKMRQEEQKRQLPFKMERFKGVESKVTVTRGNGNGNGKVSGGNIKEAARNAMRVVNGSGNGNGNGKAIREEKKNTSSNNNNNDNNISKAVVHNNDIDNMSNVSAVADDYNEFDSDDDGFQNIDNDNENENDNNNNNMNSSFVSTVSQSKSNKKPITYASSRFPQPINDSIVSPPLTSSPLPPLHRHEDYGKVPQYIKERKDEMQLVAEKKAAEKKRKSEKLPPGMKKLSENERVETLKLLNEKKVKLEEDVRKFPLVMTTMARIKAKKALEDQLEEVDEAIRLFSRKVVFVTE